MHVGRLSRRGGGQDAKFKIVLILEMTDKYTERMTGKGEKRKSWSRVPEYQITDHLNREAKSDKSGAEARCWRQRNHD